MTDFLPAERQAYRIDSTGALSKLKRVRERIAAPKPNEICVEVRAIGLNFADIFAIFGLYSATPKGSFVPGLEYAGVVVEAGSAVMAVAVGQRVMGAVRFGAYTTHVTIDENYVVPLPEPWSFEEGAAFVVQALTAYYALHHLGAMQHDSTILIHSAAGGVGLYANRIAKSISGGAAFTIGTVGSSTKIELLNREGYDRAIVRPQGNSRRAAAQFKRDLETALDGRPLNLILDSLGGRIMRAGYDTLAPAGRMVCFGSAHLAFQSNRPNYLSLGWQYLQRPQFDPLEMIEQNKAILGFNLIYLWENLPLMKQMLAELDAMRLPKPFVGQVFPFERLHDALVQFQSGTTVGKVVVTVAPASAHASVLA